MIDSGVDKLETLLEVHLGELVEARCVLIQIRSGRLGPKIPSKIGFNKKRGSFLFHLRGIKK